MPRMRAVIRAPAPPPPSAAGTVSESRPASDKALKFSKGKLPSRSCATARSAKIAERREARSTLSGPACCSDSRAAMLPDVVTMLHPVQAGRELACAIPPGRDRLGDADAAAVLRYRP